METQVSVTEISQVAEARRQVAALAKSEGFSETLQGKAALVVTEAATNLVKYGGGAGYILARPYAEPKAVGIEILSLDNGQGMPCLADSVSDGYSTGGTLGLGLGSMSRQSALFEVYTGVERGTAILARVQDEWRPWDKVSSRARVSGGFSAGAAQAGNEPVAPVGEDPVAGSQQAANRTLVASGVSTPKSGQDVCGDSWACRWAGGALWTIIVDGLGHGPLAMLASQEALRVFHAAGVSDSPYDVVRACHAALKSTRGAVMAVAVVRPMLGTVDFAGVGNIAATLFQPDQSRRLGSTDGTVGYSVRTIREQSYPWTPDSMLVMHTDGLSARWNLAGHPGLASRHPSLVAAVLHRDFARNNDDATVVVVKDKGF